MGAVRILVVEDNPLHQENIMISIDSLGYELVGMADHAGEAMALFHSTQPDIVLMDIEILGDEDGIAVAQKMNTVRPTPIIFTTALSDIETMRRAHTTQPYAYMVKPVDEKNLTATIELAVYQFAFQAEKQEKIDPNDFKWDEDVLLKDSLFIKQADRLVKVNFSDILSIEVNRERYCEVRTEKDTFLVRSSLKELFQKLPEKDFIQVHRSALVNIHHISSIDDQVHLGNISVPLGRRFKESILKKLQMI